MRLFERTQVRSVGWQNEGMIFRLKQSLLYGKEIRSILTAQIHWSINHGHA